MAPIAPFFAEQLYRDLNERTGRLNAQSVHLSLMPQVKANGSDAALEQRMQLAQDISSLVLSLRKRENLKVRQPLSRMLIPVMYAGMQEQVEQVSDLIRTEVNVKTIEFITDTAGVVTKKIKPNFKALGPKYPQQMKAIAAAVQQFTQDDIFSLERVGSYALQLGETQVLLLLEDVDILSEDIPGWLVAS